MEWISILIELTACVISFGICTTVLNAEFSKRKSIPLWNYLIWGTLFVLVTYFEITSNIVSSALGMGICLCFAQVYFSGSLWAKLISVLRVNVFTILIGIGSIQLISALSGLSVDLLTQNGSGVMRIVIICMTKGLCILAAYFYIGSFKGESYLSQEERLISVFFSVSFFVVAFFFLILIKGLDLTNTLQIAFAGVIFLLFVINVSVLFLLHLLHNQNQKLLENSILKMQLHEQERLIEATEKDHQDMRKFRHDVKRYFTNYLYLLEAGDVDIVKEEMRKTLDQKLSVNQRIYTSSVILNAVINEKMTACEKQGIPLYVNIQLPVNIESMELAIVLSNLLDNAMEAELTEPQKGIWLHIKVIDTMVNLIVENRIKKSILENNPHLHTTKEDKQKHGMGIRIVREIVHQFQGFFDVEEDEEKFIVHVMILVANFARNQ